ncbi:MAG: tetratricopeptide repeat protein [Anaerolineales bacterium]|nr:tetratricopeptide repeat protein [Anaerolineales bacterium]
MARLSLSFLGPFQAQLDNQPVSGFQSDKARALLAYLAVEGNQPHRRDRLVGLFWPDWPDSNARANLRHALNNLRTVLRDRNATPPFLLSDRQTIHFNPDSSYRLDVAEFSRLVDRRPTAPQTDEMSEQAVERLQQAIALYTGPFLTGLFLEGCAAFEEWSLLTRERLQIQLLATLQNLTHHFEQQGNYEFAFNYARQQVEIDPLQEQAHRHLMRLLARTGQRSAALVQFETLRQRLADELDVAPSAETTALHQQIQTGQLPSPAELMPETIAAPSSTAPPPHNLPAQLTSFIGRSAELGDIQDKLLQPDIRLLTLTGPGGTGKTRLALKIAGDLLNHFADGVYFVALAPLRDPELIVSTIAEVLQLHETADRIVIDLLAEYIQDKRLLLILDNFEHLTEAGPLLTDLLTNAANLKILATSRTPLHLYGEHCYPVSPLPLPDAEARPSLDNLLENEACQLFTERARAVKPNFALTSENVQTVAEICTRVDGLPLAIELAAARISLLPPPKLLGQLNRRLHILTKGAKNLPERHQTLRNTIDWSYELLTPEEQALFRRLAVFAGSCSLEAAEAVGNISGEIDLFDGLESLVDKSLLRQLEVNYEPRFVMLESIREYGLEQLQANDETEVILQSCVDYYLSWAEEMAQLLQECDEESCVEQVEIEHDNLRAVLHSFKENRQTEFNLRLVGLLWRFWEMRGHFTEGRQWLEQAVTGSGEVDPALRAEAYTGAGTMAWYQTDYQSATTHHQVALTLYQESGDEQGVAFALNNLGAQANAQGNNEQATKYFEESIALSNKLGDKLPMSYALHNLSEVAKHQGNYGRALALAEEALSIMREHGNKWMIARQLANVGQVQNESGNSWQAAPYFKESLLLSHELGNNECVAICIEGYAMVALAQAQPERAAQLLGAAENLREIGGAPLSMAYREAYDHKIAQVHDALGEAAFAAAWAAGRAMTLEQAVAYALEDLPQ